MFVWSLMPDYKSQVRNDSGIRTYETFVRSTKEQSTVTMLQLSKMMIVMLVVCALGVLQSLCAPTTDNFEGKLYWKTESIEIISFSQQTAWFINHSHRISIQSTPSFCSQKPKRE